MGSKSGPLLPFFLPTLALRFSSFRLLERLCREARRQGPFLIFCVFSDVGASGRIEQQNGGQLSQGNYGEVFAHRRRPFIDFSTSVCKDFSRPFLPILFQHCCVRKLFCDHQSIIIKLSFLKILPVNKIKILFPLRWCFHYLEMMRKTSFWPPNIGLEAFLMLCLAYDNAVFLKKTKV